MIVRAAIRTKDGTVFVAGEGLRHDECFRLAAKSINYDITTDDQPGKSEEFHQLMHGHEQGFTTDTGEFLDRKAAFLHAVACGQLRGAEDLIAPSVLTSEDLW